MQKYNWNYPTTMWVGENRVNDIAQACKNLNILKPLFVTDKGLAETNLVVSIEASETGYWKKYTGKNGLNFGINDFGKSAPYKKIYNHFGLDVENILKKIKKKL